MWDFLRHISALPIERLSIDTEDLGGGGDVSVGMSQNARNVARLQIVKLHQFAGQYARLRARHGFRQQKIARIDHRIGRQSECALDQILESLKSSQ